jgi:virginiamycin B lyase
VRFGLAAALAIIVSLLGAAQSSAAITEFPLPTSASVPTGIASGPDGNLWVTEPGIDRIARITPAGTVTEFTLPAGREPTDIVAAAGLIFFTERSGDRIGRLDPSAANVQASIVEFIVPGVGSRPTEITVGPDGNLWFVQSGSDQVGQMTPGGVITEHGIQNPVGIASGSDGAIWITDTDGLIARLTTVGVLTNLFRPPAVTGTPPRFGQIVAGPDGALWYVDQALDHVRRITTAGLHSQFAAPAGSTL